MPIICAVYQEEIKQMEEKGVSICECNVPTSDELTYKTNDEMKSISFGLEIAEYFENSDIMSEEKKECLYRIFGKKNVIELKNSRYDMETIPLGELMGRITKGMNHRKRIYLIGLCIVYGYGCKEDHTLHAYLQKSLNIRSYR